MHSALTRLPSVILSLALQLFLIALLLVAGSYLLKHWGAIARVEHDRAVLTASVDAIGVARQELSRQVRGQVSGMRSASIASIDGRIAAIDDALGRMKHADTMPLMQMKLPLPAVDGLKQYIIDQGVRSVRREILEQERQYLLQGRALLVAGLDRKMAQVRSAELHTMHLQLLAQHAQAAAYIARLRNDHPIASEFGFGVAKQINSLQRSNNALAYKIEQVHASNLAQQRALSMLGMPKALATFRLDETRLDNAMAPTLALKNAADQATLADRAWLFFKPVVNMLPAALMLVISAFLAHLLVKALLFYVLAPIAARRPPICLDPARSGAIGFRSDISNAPEDRPAASRVSTEVTLGVGEEMLVLPEYVQGSVVRGNKDTQWLLDWSCPFTSLAAGMCALTRIRHHAAEKLVVSSGNDPFCEIALITLHDDGAMVFHPRGMVGVIYHSAIPLRISRHWQLGSLHAWLTLQLRYLVFHGPVTLIVKGNRGVRIEPAGRGRAIRQNATLGFSVNVQYSTVRCDTFFPFYRSKTPLLQDAFCGESGFYVYDETPIGSGRHGGHGKRTEGLMEAVLKIFGI